MEPVRKRQTRVAAHQRAGTRRRASAQAVRDSSDDAGAAAGGTSRWRIGAAVKKRRQAFAVRRATLTDRAWRAESVAIPVFAYIWRYSFEMSRKAMRALRDRTARDRRQMRGKE